MFMASSQERDPTYEFSGADNEIPIRNPMFILIKALLSTVLTVDYIHVCGSWYIHVGHTLGKKHRDTSSVGFHLMPLNSFRICSWYNDGIGIHACLILVKRILCPVFN